MTREDLINQRATTCRHGGHCEWVACDKCNHYESKPETITNSTSGYLEVMLPECDDCISRQEALDVVHKYFEHYLQLNDDICLDGLRSLPSVTPKEKIGKWIFDEILDRHYYCSECKSMGVDYWDYCPECGAKMVEPQESEVQDESD